ncbi:hypothetical protein B0H17DRAFT_1125074 [Mycena rosella]|uniref:Uncharacterized protein n=1 Tax=Mycena rosella TaxID=1033263 RepID=A0AAD7GYW7_MYCRO|nr:hypothetical protein B0H17DRAFT_1125074 [Mycena rosella]
MTVLFHPTSLSECSATLLVAAVKPPLPAASEASTALLVESDFSNYLHPLYKYGWGFSINRLYAEHPEHGLSFLRRSSIFIFPDLTTSLELCSLDSVTRNTIRLALEIETEYRKICPDTPSSDWRPISKVNSLAAARALVRTVKADPFPGQAPRKSSSRSAPIVHVPLPSPPSTTSFPPPSITQADLTKYVRPLIANGWLITGMPVPRQYNKNSRTSLGPRRALKGCPSLRCQFRFHDYTSAKDFFHTVVTLLPPPPPNSLVCAEYALAGVQVLLRRKVPTRKVELWSISEWTDSAEKYGLSHNDVHFAIEVEAVFKNWRGKAINETLPTVAPIIMEQLWNYKKLPGASVE